MAVASTTWRTERALDFVITKNSNQEGLFSNSRTACDPRCSATIRNDQDIIPHVPLGLDGISLVFRSISQQRRTCDQIYERVCCI
ncbi:unnamed protein product [Hymenolepis diminuta]|uniref:Uncharacterized protein n=1 Tax=Hymenolepis diminuta TaxID=6216 RepID=A0A564Y1W8_HYMDI|nr:unnamed protein product [Hymenolepis diminuta]